VGSRKGLFRWESVAERLSIFALHAAAYRLLGGRLVGKNILLLTTTGRRTGKRRTTPLFYARDGTDFIVIASNGGEDAYPGWWYNIRKNPTAVEMQVGRDGLRCHAAEVTAQETAALWAKLTAVFAGYEGYRRRTRRELTMFRLRPVPAAGPTPAAGRTPVNRPRDNR
jgi:deazaflavin-dependent oxidoreductase (nitroreductase family)